MLWLDGSDRDKCLQCRIADYLPFFPTSCCLLTLPVWIEFTVHCFDTVSPLHCFLLLNKKHQVTMAEALVLLWVLNWCSRKD